MIAPRIRNRIFVLTAVIAVAFITRSWLLGSSADSGDSLVPIKLSAEFDPFLKQADLIRPLHEKKRPVKPGDWLEGFPEGGQTFGQFAMFHQFKPAHDELKGIDIQPIGEFDATQEKIIKSTAEFMSLYFGTECRVLEPKPFGEIPASAQRMRNETPQVLTTWILDEILMPERRPDALVTIAIVTCDLWPGDLNWVFGQARMTERVAIWSLHRNGDPRPDPSAYRLCLRRTLKTGAHEIGHALGIPHCAPFECCMNGSRSREENDSQSLEFCPECQPKIWWSCGADPVKRSQALHEFCEREGLTKENEFFRREWEVLKKSR